MRKRMIEFIIDKLGKSLMQMFLDKHLVNLITNLQMINLLLTQQLDQQIIFPRWFVMSPLDVLQHPASILIFRLRIVIDQLSL